MPPRKAFKAPYGFLPNVSDTGPANNAPTPNPIRYNPVARDSVTSLTPNSAAAGLSALESIELATPTTKPMPAINAVANILDG